MFDDYGLSTAEIWINGDWFYTPVCGVFIADKKAIIRSPPDNLTR